MKGSFEVKIARRRGTKYSFTVRRNITVVRGDSGSGKTTLFDMVADYARLGEQSGVVVQCDCPCVALTDVDWRHQLSGFEQSIVFVDEGLRDLLSDEFAAAVKASSCYFVLITRADIPSLPYSVDEVYRIKTSGKFHTFEPLYQQHEHFRYAISKMKPRTDFDALLVEDAKSGYQFFGRHFEGSDVSCETAGTNSAILNWLDQHLDSHVFVVADGAAFGAFVDRVLKLQDAHRDNITVCLPESFEWLLLRSGLIKSERLTGVLDDPGAHIESAQFMSWEQFFTAVLKEETRRTPFAYRKSEIADAYCIERNASSVMALIACRNVR